MEPLYHRREYSYSSFSRGFILPDDVKQEDIQATYDSGVLWLLIPKKEETKAAHAKSIAVIIDSDCFGKAIERDCLLL